MRTCFHIHTKYSFDSLMSPKKIIKRCNKFNVDTIFITDHNTIKGSIIAKKYSKPLGIESIIGTEIKTQYGDVIGVYLNEEIKSREFDVVIDMIKTQGGISILPHPFRDHKNIEYLTQRVDIIETWNGHSTPLENKKAIELAKKYNKPTVVGSDAHIYAELGNAIMDCKNLWDYNKKTAVKYPSAPQREISNIIGHIKMGRIWNIPSSIIKMVSMDDYKN